MTTTYGALKQGQQFYFHGAKWIKCAGRHAVNAVRIHDGVFGSFNDHQQVTI